MGHFLKMQYLFKEKKRKEKKLQYLALSPDCLGMAAELTEVRVS